MVEGQFFSLLQPSLFISFLSCIAGRSKARDRQRGDGPTGRAVNAEAIAPQSPMRAKGWTAMESEAPRRARWGRRACEREARRKDCGRCVCLGVCWFGWVGERRLYRAFLDAQQTDNITTIISLTWCRRLEGTIGMSMTLAITPCSAAPGCWLRDARASAAAPLGFWGGVGVVGWCV